MPAESNYGAVSSAPGSGPITKLQRSTVRRFHNGLYSFYVKPKAEVEVYLNAKLDRDICELVVLPDICHTFLVTTARPSQPVAMLSRPSTTRYICRRCNDIVKRSRTAARSYTTSAGAKPEIYDVVCVGGGPAGLSLLTALSRYSQRLFCLPCVSYQLALRYQADSLETDQITSIPLQGQTQLPPDSESLSSRRRTSQSSGTGAFPQISTRTDAAPSPRHPHTFSTRSAHGHAWTGSACRHIRRCRSGTASRGRA